MLQGALSSLFGFFECQNKERRAPTHTLTATKQSERLPFAKAGCFVLVCINTRLYIFCVVHLHLFHFKANENVSIFILTQRSGRVNTNRTEAFVLFWLCLSKNVFKY